MTDYDETVGGFRREILYLQRNGLNSIVFIKCCIYSGILLISAVVSAFADSTSTNVTTGILVPVTVGVTPCVSVNGIRSDSAYNFINYSILGGRSKVLMGCASGGFMHVTHGVSAGIQTAGCLNVTGGALYGVQWSGGINRTACGAGLQAGMLSNKVAGRFTGIQVAPFLNRCGRIAGIQAGAINAASAVWGIQAGGVNTVLTDSGCATDARSGVLGGMQAGFRNYGINVFGVQIGMFNVADTLTGCQIGVINVTRKSTGCQIGLINVSEQLRWGIPVGLVNVFGKPFFAFALSYSEMGLLHREFAAGNRYFHSVYEYADIPDNYDYPVDERSFYHAFGFGTEVPVRGPFFVSATLLPIGFLREIYGADTDIRGTIALDGFTTGYRVTRIEDWISSGPFTIRLGGGISLWKKHLRLVGSLCIRWADDLHDGFVGVEIEDPDGDIPGEVTQRMFDLVRDKYRVGSQVVSGCSKEHQGDMCRWTGFQLGLQLNY